MTDYALAARAASELDLDGKRRLLAYLTTSIEDAEAQDGDADAEQPQSGLRCDECGQSMILTDTEVSHHVGTDGDIDHDADAHHVAHTTDTAAASVWIESLHDEPAVGPFASWIDAFDAMDERGLDDSAWKVVDRA